MAGYPAPQAAVASPVAAIQRVVSEAFSTPAAARARPLADLPVDALAARAGELAQAWALALVLSRSPERIGDIPLPDIALDGPPLCAAVVRALGSDAELGRLAGGPTAAAREGSAPARRLAVLAGAADAASVVEAAEALRGVVWQALVGELRAPAARELADAGDRLAHVCAVASAAALDAIAADAPAADAQSGPSVGVGPGARQAVRAGGAVIVDERDAGAEGRAPEVVATSPEAPAPVIEIRDERGGEGPAAWIGAIGDRLDRFRLDGVPFAVLLVELTDLERAGEPDGVAEADRLAYVVERLLAAELHADVRASGAPALPDPTTLTCERPGRYWLLAPRVDRAGAERLAERLTLAVESIDAAHGHRVSLAIGTASCPQDGREASALAAHADVGLYAARAASRMAAAQPSRADRRA